MDPNLDGGYTKVEIAKHLHRPRAAPARVCPVFCGFEDPKTAQSLSVYCGFGALSYAENPKVCPDIADLGWLPNSKIIFGGSGKFIIFCHDFAGIT